MDNNSSARYYQINKERLQKRLIKGIKIYRIRKKKSVKKLALSWPGNLSLSSCPSSTQFKFVQSKKHNNL